MSATRWKPAAVVAVLAPLAACLPPPPTGSTSTSVAAVTSSEASAAPPTTIHPLPSIAPPSTLVVSLRELCKPVPDVKALFDSGKADLKGVDSASLMNIVVNLLKARDLSAGATVAIIGHTDSVPTDFPGGNQGLSEARANAVYDELLRIEVNGARMTPEMVSEVRGAAADEPRVKPEVTPEDRAQNRRVEVIFTCIEPDAA